MSPFAALLTLTLALTHLSTCALIRITANANYDGPASSSPFEFVPNDLTAKVGDTLEFHFAGPGLGVLGGNHSVAQGVWGNPCVPASSGFFSGYMPVNATSTEADMIFQVEVKNTDPMVFYCTQGTHCTRGMFGVLNAAGDQTLKSYRDSITVDKPGVAASNVGGGRLLPNSVSNILAATNPDAARSMKVSLPWLVVGLGLALVLAQ